MPQFDFAHVFWPQLAWLAFFFVVLYFGVVQMTLPKLGRMMGEREDKIAGDIAAAQSAKQVADEVDARYRDEMDKSREQARKAIADAKAKASRASELRLVEAGAKAEAQIVEAEVRIAKSAKAARATLQDAAAESAQAIVARLTGIEPKLDAAKQSVNSQF